MPAKRKNSKFSGSPTTTKKVTPVIKAAVEMSAPASVSPRFPLEQVFRDRLREWLAKRNWTQKDLADRMRKAPARISHLLSGERRPELTTLQELAEALEIEPMLLLDRKSLFRDDL